MTSVDTVVLLDHLILQGRGQHVEPPEVVVTVALDVAESEGGYERQVLLEGDRTGRSQVLGGKQVLPLVPFVQMCGETGIDYRLENPLQLLTLAPP
ncbi:hypothetical protein C5C07_17480 [Haloferax sp. Atlit-4N]|uniref:hypothetical protein n=1 Tax=Haloferax sp. Atlit-4N TaxID=2077206 RepID=UPI000E232765|nr:hypothetical protein [Haloferax sp. Atlit-4N]RDZ51366.1 hypothetical protein C5C07_17480 [Haloferax sp. Atlit-4N]